MTAPSKSYKQIFYDLRPGKQVERRMIMDALGRLMNGGIPIRDLYDGLNRRRSGLSTTSGMVSR